MVELIEAAARSGKPELAADALGQLLQTTAASGTDWALGIEAGSRAPTSCTANGRAASVAERARAELKATGEHARKRTVETRDDMTPQEA